MPAPAPFIQPKERKQQHPAAQLPKHHKETDEERAQQQMKDEICQAIENIYPRRSIYVLGDGKVLDRVNNSVRPLSPEEWETLLGWGYTRPQVEHALGCTGSMQNRA